MKYATGDPDFQAPEAPALRFYTAAELDGLVPPHVDWLVGPGLVALGAITEIDGKIKAAGKTTFTLYAVRAVLDGREFLGYPTRRAKVVYVTEQSRETFTDALRRADMHARGEELQILFRSDLGGIAWPQLVGQTRVEGYDVCVFDTIGKLAGIKNENDAGEWATAMTPLNDLAASGRAVIVARHDRKGGGEVGDSGRGSSQASGDVDIILALRRPEGNQPSNRRVVEALSRYAQTPDKVVIELTDQGYVLLGGDEAVAQSDAYSFVCNLLGNKLQTNPFPASSAELSRAREDGARTKRMGDEERPGHLGRRGRAGRHRTRRQGRSARLRPAAGGTPVRARNSFVWYSHP